MPYSPLVSKIRVYNPNKKGAAAANRNGVVYIATRPGVSLETENQDYLRYIAKRPRSHGLFGNIDTENLKEVSENIYDITKNGKIIYKGIISLSEKDAEELGFRNANAWNNYLTRVMPDIAEELQISSNYTWVAAFHAEEKHPHVHYMLWDNTDKVKSPFIHKSVQQKIRINLEEEMFDDAYNQGIKQALAQEFEELNQIRNEERTNILEETKNIMSETAGYAPGMECERLPSRSSDAYMKELTGKIEKLLEVLPGKGAFKYAYLPTEAKQQLWKIVDMILQKSDINSSKENYLKQVENNGRLLGLTQTKIRAETKKASDDINRRIANKVLKEIKQTYFYDREETELSSAQKHFEDPEELEDFPEIDEKQWEKWINEGNYEKFEEDGIWTEPSSVQEHFENPEELEYFPEIDEKQWEQWVNEGNYQGPVDNSVGMAQECVAPGKLYIEWNKEYKKAMESIYNETPDFKQGFERLKQEADKGNVLAMIETSKLITKGLVETDAEVGQYYAQSGFDGLEKIYQFYEKSDNKKEVYMREYAAYRLGKYYMYATEPVKEIDCEKAKEWLMKAGDNKYALYSLGKLYQEEKIFVSEEHNKEENLQMAKTLYHKASDGLKKPNPYAAYELGCIYANKENPEHYDLEKGIEYLEKSEAQDNAYAQYKLGCLYADKENEKLYDLGKALEYLEKSEAQDNEYAQYKLGCIYANKENEKIYDIKKAIEYLEKSEVQDNEYAQYKLGCIYADKENKGVYNLGKALEYLEKSEAQDNEYAQYKLGCLYADKENEKIYDIPKALEYLKKSEAQDNEYAQYKLGCLHLDATIPEYYDVHKAINYLGMAANQDNAYAQCKLGCIYYFGKSGVQDKMLGEYWLDKAIENGNVFAKNVLEFHPDTNMVPLGVSYCLLKGALTSIETLGRDVTAQNAELARTHSKQAMREKHLHKDNSQDMDY